MSEAITIARNITVNAPPPAVQAYLVDFRRWQDWSPWEALDPNLQRTFSGPDSGVGAHYAWTGNRKAGAGTMEITSVTPDRVLIDLNFLKPFKSSATVTFDVVPSADTTTVTWTISMPRTFGLRVAGLFMNFEKAIGGDLERGLSQLQEAAQSS